MKPVNAFVSRLNPNTNSDDVSECVAEIIQEALGFVIPMTSINSEKLKTRYDSYSSFSVKVTAEESAKSQIIKLLMSGESWPEGVLVRKY